MVRPWKAAPSPFAGLMPEAPGADGAADVKPAGRVGPTLAAADALADEPKVTEVAAEESKKLK